MKTEKKCKVCGHRGDPQNRIIASGHQSAQDLGRPFGCKGRDWADTEQFCINCNTIEPGWDEVPVPCWVCGSETPSTSLDEIDGFEGAVPFSGSVPGIPFTINLCLSCVEIAKIRIEKRVDELFEAGAFEE